MFIMETTKAVPLTQSLSVESGAHILYFYQSLHKYIEQLVSFILSGLSADEDVIIAIQPEHYTLVMERLENSNLQRIHYINNFSFYGMDGKFEFESVLNSLYEQVKPHIKLGRKVRFWGHVEWADQDSIEESVRNYENSCDVTISELGFTTVCAYDSSRVPSTIFLDMMTNHEYMMTDDAFFRSHLYKTSNKHNPTAYPSLSQKKLHSEIDLYKQKLDFVHVVSHEVRNPLTVINAYAKLLLETEVDPDRRKKLLDIQNNVVVIDNEITHIIHTEQMLSTDALWQKKLMKVSQVVLEVVTMMSIKAETQNRTLQTEINLTGNEIILSTHLGLKLILSNLISNAIKYSFEGSKIIVKVLVIGNHLKIAVADNGIGMSQEEQKKLFVKYEKINQDQIGQGIGLFMVKTLVDHFKGDIQVESSECIGTTFTVHLPLRN